MQRTHIREYMNMVLNANDKEGLEKGLKKAQNIKNKSFGNDLYFYAPSFQYYKTDHFCSSPSDFPTISVTGMNCSLNCKHCGRKVLKTMYSATSPQELYELCHKLAGNGALGCLISGGCMPDGSVPLHRFVDTISKIKSELNLQVIVHTGIITSKTAQALGVAGVDAALIDIIGSDETIKEIYNLNVTSKAYEDSLTALSNAQIPFVPHVIVGLYYGRLRGEITALQMISKYKPSALVIIAFMPIKGTKMEKISPPKPLEIAKILAITRLMFPKTPLALGCMRPKGGHRIETDTMAIKAGVNAIAFPAREAIEFAKKRGYRTHFSSLCCSQSYMKIKPKNPS